MTTTKGFSVRIFIPSGEPEALRLVEKSNWTGQGLVFPRAQYAEVRKRSELNKTGIYSPSTAAGVLLGRSSNGRTEWKDAKGQRLKEIQEAAATAKVEGSPSWSYRVGLQQRCQLPEADWPRRVTTSTLTHHAVLHFHHKVIFWMS